jgi:predicted enzyme related to lactoylglutathione lyase
VARLPASAPHAAILRPGNIVLDTANPRLVDFWASLTGYQPRDLFGNYVGLRDPSGIGPNLTLQMTPAPTRAGRCHFDLYSDDPAAAAARAVELGARRIREVREGDVAWIVLEDPDGNQFCIVAAVGQDRTP